MDMSIATRLEGERRLEAFKPLMGSRYANWRNYDRGPGAHRDVSGLSPYLRRRLVLEQDVVTAAISAYGPDGAGKFVQEVFWRGYFKGWLERRPASWTSYRNGLQNDLQMIDGNRRLRRRVEYAEAGQTGIACFDAWAQELVETGYLHNHARMWFASIWIFTLELPWRVGADFFYRHLLDGDPASNTLGWRWVAGLHTRGKPYVAQAWNIAQFTHQRFTPRDSDLASGVVGLEYQEPDGLPPVQSLRTVSEPVPALPALLLITEEDCRIEDFGISGLNLCGAGTLAASHLRSPGDVAEAVIQFEADALAAAAERFKHKSAVTAEPLRAGVPRDLASWAASHSARQIVTPYIPEGPIRDWMREAQPALDKHGVTVCEWRREWDSLIWRHSTAGFFKVKEHIPAILERMGMA
jgi:deoxyribodipyrimidine photo-lyase